MYQYWLLQYISCEGNNRWTIIRSLDLQKDDVITMIPLGGCGDDISEVISIDESSDFLMVSIDIIKTLLIPFTLKLNNEE